MAGLNRMGRWVLAVAVIATAPLAGWGGGCSRQPERRPGQRLLPAVLPTRG